MHPRQMLACLCWLSICSSSLSSLTASAQIDAQLNELLRQGKLAEAQSLSQTEQDGGFEQAWTSVLTVNDAAYLSSALLQLRGMSTGMWTEQVIWTEACLAHAQGRSQDAIAGFQLFLSTFPQSRNFSEAQLLLASSLLDGNRAEDVIGMLTTLLLKQPAADILQRATILLGDAHLATGHRDLAIVQFRTAATLTGSVADQARGRLIRMGVSTVPADDWGDFFRPTHSSPTPKPQQWTAPAVTPVVVPSVPPARVSVPTLKEIRPTPVPRPPRAQPMPGKKNDTQPRSAPKPPGAQAKPRSPGKSDEPKPAPTSFYVQVVSTARRRGAEDLYDSLRRRGYSAEIREDKSRGDVRYRVWVGPYRSRDEAKQVAADLRSAMGVNGYVLSAPTENEDSSRERR